MGGPHSLDVADLAELFDPPLVEHPRGMCLLQRLLWGVGVRDQGSGCVVQEHRYQSEPGSAPLSTIQEAQNATRWPLEVGCLGFGMRGCGLRGCT